MTAADPNGKTSLQSKKQEVVRHEIRNAAIDLFHATGFDDVTIDQIATRAGISRRTFFRYFASKEDVLASGVREYGAALAEVIAHAPSRLRPLHVARLAILQVLEPHLPATERVIRIAKQSASARSAHLHQTPIVEQELTRAFAARMRREARPRLDDRILANLTLFATSLSVEAWVDQHHRPFAEIVEEVFTRFSAVCLPAAPAPPPKPKPTPRASR